MLTSRFTFVLPTKSPGMLERQRFGGFCVFPFDLDSTNYSVLRTGARPAVSIQVDATQEESLGTKFGVSGYPTLKWFIDGELASDYNGPREA